MKKKLNIAIWQEWDMFVTRVLENNISSFWYTKEEALNTYEAIELYYEFEKDNDYLIKTSIPYKSIVLIMLKYTKQKIYWGNNNLDKLV